MVGVAQLVEPRIVIPVVAGSNPVAHPIPPYPTDDLPMATTDPATTPPAAVDETLDVQGLDCPLPILHTRKRLNQMQPGQTLRVIATDPASPIDFKAFCLRTGHDLLHAVEGPGRFEYYLRKSPDAREG